MRRQLQKVIDEFESAEGRLQELLRRVPMEFWNRRARPQQWSISECIAHLNLTSEAFIPLLRDGLARAASLPAPTPKRYRRDLTGWLLWKSAGPPVRFRVKTTAPFVPSAAESPDALVATFHRFQEEQLDCTRRADGLALTAVRIISPFDSRFRYNLYSCLTILPRHQHRHLWQAERVFPEFFSRL